MTREITRKCAIARYGDDAIRIGYCDLQYLLRGYDRDYYTAGVYGWNCDIYIFKNATITTGYRGMFGRSVDYELTRKYDNMARKVWNDNSLSYDEQKNKVDVLLNEYLEQALAA